MHNTAKTHTHYERKKSAKSKSGYKINFFHNSLVCVNPRVSFKLKQKRRKKKL